MEKLVLVNVVVLNTTSGVFVQSLMFSCLFDPKSQCIHCRGMFRMVVCVCVECDVCVRSDSD